MCIEALVPPVKIQAALPLTWGEAGSDAGGGAMESSHEPGWAVSEHVSKLRKMNKSRKKGSKRKLIAKSKNICEICANGLKKEKKKGYHLVYIKSS